MAKAKVFAVPKDETADGRFHEVTWAKDGNLNLAVRRGNVKRFRDWRKAKAFAAGKAKTMKAELITH